MTMTVLIKERKQNVHV